MKAVAAVEQIIDAELKNIVRRRLVTLIDERKLSPAPMTMAASPPNNKSAAKINVSDIEIDDSKRKKGTTRREAMASVARVINRKGKPSRASGRL